MLRFATSLDALAAALVPLAVLASACGDGGTDTTTSSATGTGGASSAASTTSGPAGPATSSGSSASASSSGSGGGDAGWAPLPWWDKCPLEYATVPSNALAPLTWEPCTFGEAGCSKLVKSWVPYLNSGPQAISARRAGGGYELSLFLVRDEGDVVTLATDSGGSTIGAYRAQPSAGAGCGLSAVYVAEGGHWVGGIKGSESTYVFQPLGAGPAAAQPTTLLQAAQRRDGGDTLFAIEWYAAGKLEIYDRTQDQTFSIGVTPGSSFYFPRVNASSVFFMRADATDDPNAWIWTRADNTFREFISAGDKVVSDIRTDGETLVWVETPQAVEGSGFPPGILYTSPFTTDPKAIVKTARWNDFPVPPSQLSVMGSGYYAAVAEALNQILILRVSDGRRWTIPIPANEFDSYVISMPYIDAEVLFLSTETDAHRIDLTAIGDGTPE